MASEPQVVMAKHFVVPGDDLPKAIELLVMAAMGEYRRQFPDDTASPQVRVLVKELDYPPNRQTLFVEVGSEVGIEDAEIPQW